MKAVWKDTVLAESDDTIAIEGNHYFPPESIKEEYFRESETHTVCAWKGVASYYNIAVNGETNKEAAKDIKNYVAFWRGIKVVK